MVRCTSEIRSPRAGSTRTTFCQGHTACWLALKTCVGGPSICSCAECGCSPMLRMPMQLIFWGPARHLLAVCHLVCHAHCHGCLCASSLQPPPSIRGDTGLDSLSESRALTAACLSQVQKLNATTERQCRSHFGHGRRTRRGISSFSCCLTLAELYGGASPKLDCSTCSAAAEGYLAAWQRCAYRSCGLSRMVSRVHVL